MFDNSSTQAEGHMEEKKNLYDFFHVTLFIVIAALSALGLYLFIIIAEEDTSSMQAVSTNDTVASLRLVADKPAYTTGDEALVTVFLSTNRRTSGVDVVIRFDPDYLELVQGTGTARGFSTPAGVYFADVRPPVYENFPYAKLEQSGEMMTFSFSAITKPLETFKGGGPVATLRFKVLKSGVTAIDIISNKRQTQNSNVAFEGKDILTAVEGVSITIN